MTEPFFIPTIRTDRLTLRPFFSRDLDPFVEIVADPAVIQYATYNGDPVPRAQAWNWLCLMLGHWHLREFGIWAVEENRTGELIGRIGLQYLEWFDDVELVWMLKKSAWRKGFGSEGARAAIRYGFETLGIPRLSAVIHTGNLPSIKLAEALGMHFERKIERQDIQFLEYVLEKPSRSEGISTKNFSTPKDEKDFWS
jgi:RimJ/RimL family protein N-acetyltransferase